MNWKPETCQPVSPEFSIIINGQRLYAAKQVKNIWVLPSSGRVASPTHACQCRQVDRTRMADRAGRCRYSVKLKTNTPLTADCGNLIHPQNAYRVHTVSLHETPGCKMTSYNDNKMFNRCTRTGTSRYVNDSNR